MSTTIAPAVETFAGMTAPETARVRGKLAWLRMRGLLMDLRATLPDSAEVAAVAIYNATDRGDPAPEISPGSASWRTLLCYQRDRWTSRDEECARKVAERLYAPLRQVAS